MVVRRLVALLRMLTDIECVYLDFLSPRRQAVRHMTAAEVEKHLQRGEFLPGSMAPKIEAAIAFLRAGGQQVLSGLPEELPQPRISGAGTVLTPYVAPEQRKPHGEPPCRTGTLTSEAHQPQLRPQRQ